MVEFLKFVDVFVLIVIGVFRGIGKVIVFVLGGVGGKVNF